MPGTCANEDPHFLRFALQSTENPCSRQHWFKKTNIDELSLLTCGKKSSKSTATYTLYIPFCNCLHFWEKSSKSAATYTFHLPLLPFFNCLHLWEKIWKICSNIYPPPIIVTLGLGRPRIMQFDNSRLKHQTLIHAIHVKDTSK